MCWDVHVHGGLKEFAWYKSVEFQEGASLRVGIPETRGSCGASGVLALVRPESFP